MREIRDIQEPAHQELDDPIKDNLVCRQEIPLRWRKQEQPLGDGPWMMIHSENVKLMEVLVSGEDAADLEQQRDREVFKEIRKLDAKLNLMMSWMGRILWQQQEMPSLQVVNLSAKGLQFYVNANKTEPQVAENDELFMELFLEPRYPQPFTTLAQVIQVIPQGGACEVSVRFIQLSEPNQQWLDKYVFRLHRRQVAMSRKAQTVS